MFSGRLPLSRSGSPEPGLPSSPARSALTRSSLALATACLTAAATAAPAPAMVPSPVPAPDAQRAWVATWHASVVPPPVGSEADKGFTDTTFRQRLHTSSGGDAVRVRLSNVYGTQPLRVSGATLAVAAGDTGAAVRTGTLTRLSFAGQLGTTIPVGAELLSDPVAYTLPADSDVFVSLHVPGPTGRATLHGLAMSTSQTATGDHTTDVAATAFTGSTGSWYFLSGLEVPRSDKGVRGTVVAYGDSITEGWMGTQDADLRWPDVLADRLAASPGGPSLAVVNPSISGNRILLDSDAFGKNALERFDRDVLTVPGASTVIILMGINDIQQEPHQTDPAQITAGLAQMAQRAHDQGLTVVGGTLTPFKGWNPWNEDLEATRQAVNTWIRTEAPFDAVVDFDAAVRDPEAPDTILARYDSGDHLHPNDAGYRLMGEAVDLSVLR